MGGKSKGVGAGLSSFKNFSYEGHEDTRTRGHEEKTIKFCVSSVPLWKALARLFFIRLEINKIEHHVDFQVFFIGLDFDFP